MHWVPPRGPRWYPDIEVHVEVHVELHGEVHSEMAAVRAAVLLSSSTLVPLV